MKTDTKYKEGILWVREEVRQMKDNYYPECYSEWSHSTLKSAKEEIGEILDDGYPDGFLLRKIKITTLERYKVKKDKEFDLIRIGGENHESKKSK